MTPTEQLSAKREARQAHFDADYFRSLMEWLGWNQFQTARHLGTSLRTINAWANGSGRIPRLAFLYMELLLKHELKRPKR